MKNPDRYPVIVIQRKHKPRKRICQFGKTNDRKRKNEVVTTVTLKNVSAAERANAGWVRISNNVSRLPKLCRDAHCAR